MLQGWLGRVTRDDNIFPLLLGYRWLSLIPPALALFVNLPPQPGLVAALAVAVADSLALTIWHPRLNRLLVAHPISLGVDLVLAAGLIALTGGTRSPYYLFALSPLLAASFFFQIRGGLIAASGFGALYLLALGLSQALFSAVQDGLIAVTQLASFFLIAAIFGYPSILLKRIRDTSAALEKAHAQLLEKNAILERSNRELESIHALALAMQSSAVDIFDVQEKILTTITGDLEFERVMLALVDQETNVLMGWLTHRRKTWYETPDGLFASTEIPLRAGSGLLAQIAIEGKPRYIADAAPPTNDAALNARLDLAPYAVLPLIMRDHPVGVLIVDNCDSRTPIPPESFRSLSAVANQAALALGSTKLCVERAQRLAVEEERNRIAMEIHDTASQALFGIVFALDACLKRLPDAATEVRAHLSDTRMTAERTMNDLRRSVYDIWAGELDDRQFAAEVRSHLLRLDAKSLAVDIQVKGDLGLLNSTTRKNLLRITEESLSNVVKHSGATQANIALSVGAGETRLVIEDNGHGFDSHQGSAGFGLKSIRERARAIGGEVWIDSRPGEGTRLEVVLAGCGPTMVERGVDASFARR